MNTRLDKVFRVAVLGVLALGLTACVSYHQPRYGADGVYFDQTRHQPRTVVVADPLLYPYWSLDYFYFSRYYHPYSVAVSAYDPWFYPYPGWYYGYRPGAGSSFGLSVGFGTYYPWHGFGYASYRPWRPYAVRYPHYRGDPYQGPSHRVHQIDERLRAIDERERYPGIARPTSRPGAPAVRSDAMLRHRIAEDRATHGARRNEPASTPTRSSQRRPSSRPAATRRSPSTQPSRQRSSPTRTVRPQRQPPRAELRPGVDMSAFGAERRSAPRPAPAPRIRAIEPQSRPAPAARAPDQQSRPSRPSPRQEITPSRAPQARPAPSTRRMPPRETSQAPRARSRIDRSDRERDR